MTAADPATSPRTSTTYVDVSDLHPVGVRPPLGRYVADLWRRRSFVVADSRARTFTSNRDMLLGNAWLVGKPLLDGATYFVIFGLLFGAREGIENFIGFLLIGVFLFGYSSRSLTTGIGSVVAGRSLIRTFSFPRAAIPVATWLRETFTSLPTVLTLIVLVLAIPPRAPVTMTWLLFPVVLVLQAAFNLGLTLYAARFGSLIPDSKVFVGAFSRLWMYGSGVMFSIERLTAGHPRVMAICEINPLYCVLELARDTLLYGTPGDLKLWLVLGVWAVVTPLLGFVYFWHGEEQYSRE
ncbi:ABC transporter [Janibacter melonis]|uniref:ABC transporter n=1 Tax=Janibacter melonis TaxID=262209 RepID=A0A176Q9B4_9MICO|nr:ABC transporter permease [Janibacter melonis]OAB86252.1 ABC transporter [Janibacter melonis]